ncbi:MAG: hypothetical protein JWL77_263 [Chthonomonadaceae bacterium]|nr:hypothetical protein [Chthonomonadaceae bacterium]
MQTRATTVKQAVISVLKEQQAFGEDTPPVIRLASEVASSLAAQFEDTEFCYVVHRLAAYDKPYFVRALTELEQRECITIHSGSAVHWPAIAARYTLTEQNRYNLNQL